jgi:hypothetical protein
MPASCHRGASFNRVCQYVQQETGVKVGIAYEPANVWMPPCMATISPDDKTGMRRAELEETFGTFPIPLSFQINTERMEKSAKKNANV